MINVQKPLSAAACGVIPLVALPFVHPFGNPLETGPPLAISRPAHSSRSHWGNLWRESAATVIRRLSIAVLFLGRARSWLLELDVSEVREHMNLSRRIATATTDVFG